MHQMNHFNSSMSFAFCLLLLLFIYLFIYGLPFVLNCDANELSTHKLSQSVFFGPSLAVVVIGICWNGQNSLVYVALIIIRNSFCHTWFYHEAKINSRPFNGFFSRRHFILCSVKTMQSFSRLLAALHSYIERRGFLLSSYLKYPRKQI